jgi:hypothetical protein
MKLRLAHLSLRELDDLYDSLCGATTLCRSIGDYASAACLLSSRRLVLDELNRVMAETNAYKAAQLSIAPPGAYDLPDR